MKLDQLKIAELHGIYQRMTGIQISIIQREYAWAEWLNRGLDVEDLRRWIFEIKTKVSRGQLDRRSLFFTNLISNLDRAEENCLELRRLMRGHVPDTDKDSVLRSAGMAKAKDTDSVKTVSEVLRQIIPNPEAAAKAFKELQQLKNSL